MIFRTDIISFKLDHSNAHLATKGAFSQKTHILDQAGFLGKSKSGEKTHGIEGCFLVSYAYFSPFTNSVLNVAAIPICCGNKVAPIYNLNREWHQSHIKQEFSISLASVLVVDYFFPSLEW
jgi:hypothetical protein